MHNTLLNTLSCLTKASLKNSGFIELVLGDSLNPSSFAVLSFSEILSPFNLSIPFQSILYGIDSIL